MTTLKRQKIIAEVRMDVYAVIVMNKEDFFANLLSQAGYPDLEDFNWTVVRLTNYKNLVIKIWGYINTEGK